MGLRLALVVGLLLVPALPLLERPATASVSAGPGNVLAVPSLTTLGKGSCAKPASVLIPLVGPNGTAAAGDTLSASYEMEITRGGAGPLTVYLPRINAIFPTAGGGNYVLSVGPNTQTGIGKSWSSTTDESIAHKLTAPVTFSATSDAVLSSALLAVQTNTTSYQAWNISLRWSWTLTTPSGTVVSPWTGRTMDEFCPSDFYPAPRVNLEEVSNTSGPPGTVFTAELSGYVANQYFFNEIESPSGFVVFSHGQYGGATNVTNVTINFDCWCGRLTPGPYLVHIHNVEGSLLWSVSILVTNPDGLSATAASNTTGGPVPLAVAFTSNATPGKAPYSYTWSFGDGATSTVPDPAHLYTVAGNYSANVTIRDANRETAESSVLITAIVPPEPLVLDLDANVTNGTAPLRVHFQANISGGIAPYQYNWSFGANHSTGRVAPNETFFTPGLYVVTLNVTDSEGVAVEQFVDVLVHPIPGGFRVAIAPPSGHYRVPTSLAFEALVTGGASPYNVSWNFGDGSPAGAGLFENHTYPMTGNYTVSVNVTDQIGDSTNRSVYFAVFDPLTVRLSLGSPSTVVVNRPINLTANVTGGGPGDVYRWSLNGVSQSWTGPNVTFTPSILGSFLLSVRVTDHWGDQNLSSAPITVVAAPTQNPPPPGGGNFLGVPTWEWAVAGAVVVVAIVLVVWAIRRRPGSEG